MRGLLLAVFATITAVVGVACLDVGPLSAAEPTSLQITPPTGPVAIGDEVSFTARLLSNGSPVSSRRLTLSVDGALLRTAGVDANGVATLAIHGDELSAAGARQVTVALPDSPALIGSTAAFVLAVQPAQVTIVTVPPVDGVTIDFGTLSMTTSQGAAVFSVPALGSYDVSVDAASAASPDVRADFVRWGDNVFTPRRKVQVAGTASLELGLHTAYRTSIRFVDQNGTPVPAGQVDSLRLTGTGGAGMNVASFDDVWVDAATAVKSPSGLRESGRNWRVLEAMVSGTNVVNRGQQRFTPHPGDVWTISVLMFNLRVEAEDALFGSAVQGTLSLVYPDGTSHPVTLDASTPATDFNRLPRGDYVLHLKASGLVAPTPVALSRDQTAVIRIITYLDMAGFGSVMLLTVAALFWFGRREQTVAVMSAGWRGARGVFRPRRPALPGLGAMAASAARAVSRGAQSADAKRRSNGSALRRADGRHALRPHAEPVAPRRLTPIFVPPPPPAPGTTFRRPGATRSADRCPHCGRFCSSSARFCRSCGRLIAQAPPRQ